MFTKEKIINILEYFLAFFIIVNVNTIWNYSYCNQNMWEYTAIILYLLILLSIDKIITNKQVLFRMSILLIFISSYSVIFILLNGQNKQEFIIDFMVIFWGFIIYNVSLINKEKIYNLLFKVSNIIVILALISLIFYIGGSLLHIIKPTKYILLTWGWHREIPCYYNIYYEAQNIYIGGKWVLRNTGIFTEAPMYGFCLSIALITELFLRKTNGIKNIIILLLSIPILSITIITTLSTTAIGLMSVLIPIRIIISIVENRKKSKVRILISSILLGIFIILGGILGGYFLENKVKNSTNNAYGSFAVRKDDFKVGFRTWKENKFIGAGFDQFQYVQQRMNFIGRGTDIGGSSGLMKVMPEGGIVLLLLYIIPFILAIIYGVRKKDVKIISLYISIFILFSVTEIQYRYMMIYFLALGYSYILTIKKDKCLKENNK